jgi:hypothetical protein
VHQIAACRTAFALGCRVCEDTSKATEQTGMYTGTLRYVLCVVCYVKTVSPSPIT